MEGPAKRFCSALDIEGSKVVGTRGHKHDIVNVVIPNGIDEIGDEVFEYCTELTSLTLPDSLKVVGREAFWGCEGLTSLTLPNSVNSVGDQAFVNCRPGSLGRPTLWVSRGCNSLCREDRAQALSL